MGTITNSELIKAISDRLPELNEADCACSLERIIDYMAGQLAAGNRFEIRTFGSFGVRATSMPTPADASHVCPQAYFKCGRQLDMKLNRKEKASSN